jgi:cytochrome c-type biogenesis protein CcmH/NrfG
MNRGGKIIGTAAMFSVAACGGEQGKLEIRPIKAPLAAGFKAVPFRIAEARTQFALGNVALALEAFRIALREDPNSIDAMTGVAACYDRMARFDLSRRHYEAALAVAPGDPQLLAAFASSLDLQGRVAEAASVRQEIRQRTALASLNAAPQPAPAAAVAAPVTVMAAPPKPAASTALPPPPVALASRAEPVRQTVRADRPAPAAMAPVSQTKPVQTAQAPSVRVAPPVPTAAPAIGRSVTVALPPARPVAAAPPAPPKVARAAIVAPAPAPVQPPPAAPQPMPAVERAIAATRPAPVASPLPVAPTPRPAVENAVIMARSERDATKVGGRAVSGPRIERLSLREVELITVPGPQWRALTVARTQRSATVRFIPLRQAAMRPAGVRVLNAARVDRLAARTRKYLAGRGWRAISIGDAPAVRMRSLILYPADRRRMAEKLSAQFGFAIAQRPGARQVTILLGRDAARDSALRARS